MKVLVTGAGIPVGQGIIRSLRASSLNPTVVALDASPMAAGLYWADAAYIVPRADSPDYVDRFQELLGKEKPDAVFISLEGELAVLSPCREQIERDFQTHVLVSNPEVLTLTNDKWLTYQFLRSQGVDCPKSCLPGDEDHLVEAVGFPLVMKPRVGSGAVGVHIVHNRHELQSKSAFEPNAIIQEYIGTPDAEYTAGTLFFDSECRASIVMRRNLHTCDGNTYRAYVEEYPELNRMVKSVATKLKAHGPANFQFRLKDGRAMIFEINARFSSTTMFRTLAGFNEVDMTLRHILLEEPVVQPEIKPTIILRYWNETVVRPNELLRS